MKMSRRMFLGSAALGAVARAARWPVAMASGRIDPLESITPKEASEIGRLYLSSSPSEADPDVLRETIKVSLGGRFDADSVRRAVADDFANGRTVRLDGWHLSITEARLSAASYLRATRV